MITLLKKNRSWKYISIGFVACQNNQLYGIRTKSNLRILITPLVSSNSSSNQMLR